MRHGRLAGLTAALVAMTGSLLLTASPGAASPDGLDRVRAATARYHDLGAAQADGFTRLSDAAGVSCIDKAGEGGMGVHYVLGSRVGDPSIDADSPELLVYAPDANGALKLAAVEWVVLASAWHEAGHASAPALFGRTFTLVPEGNRYGLPAFYELHAWVWKHNRSGMFADYNPRVVCPA